MGEKELRELLLERLHIELNLFKDSALQKPKKDIYEASYKIEVFINAYEILLEAAGSLDAGTVRGLLYCGQGILESFYQEWLTRQDSSFAELKEFITGELGAYAEPDNTSGRKEGADGAELSQAA